MESVDQPESQVTVTRTSPEDVQQRQVILHMDDEPFGTLLFGKTIMRPVPPGRHTLRADNTWNKKTLEFDLAPGQHARFRIINRAGGCTWMLVAALGAGPMYVAIEREEEPTTAAL